MPAVVAPGGMGSAVIVDVEDAGAGSVPKASVMLLCFLNFLSFLKMVFISLSELWCSKRGNKVAEVQRFNQDSTPISLRSILFFVSQIILTIIIILIFLILIFYN